SQQFSQYITKFQEEKQVPDAHFYLAKCYEHLHKYDLAVIEYKKLSLDFPKHPKAILAWKESGKLYENTGRLKEAGKAYESIQILYSENEAAPEGLLMAGKVYYKITETVDARKAFNDILSRYPESPYVFEAELYLAKIAIDDGDYPRGIKKFKKLIQGKNNEEIIPAKIELAKTYLNMNNVARAENILKTIPEKNWNLEAVKQHIRLYWKKKQYAQSINMLQKKLRNAGNDKHIFQEMLIDAYTLNGNYDQALALYGQIYKEKISKNLKYKQLLLMVKKNDFHNFNKVLFTDCDKYLNDQVLLRLITKSLNSMKDKKAYKEILELTSWLRGKYNPSEFNKYFTGFYFLALFETEKYDDLKRYFTQNIDMIREKPAVDDALYFRSMVALTEKDYKTAFEYLSDITEKYSFSPYVENAVKNSERIEKFYLKDDKMDMDKVIHFLGVFINEKDAGNLNLLLGEMCAAQIKDFKKAMQYYKTALKHSNESKDVDVYLKMYEASWAMSQKDPKQYRSQRDSAKIYLKYYLQNEVDDKKKTLVSLDFFKKTLDEIIANNSQRNQVLKKLQAWKLNNEGDLLKINDLIYSIIPEDSMYMDIKKNSGDVKAANHDFWLARASATALKQGDSATAETLWLKLLQNYPASPFSKQAALNLLKLYMNQDAWQKYKQVFNFASTQFWYDEAIDISSEQNMVWLKNGDYE
ncbi:MAG: tetratricopeptide repeat protein, partial [Calditrichia bacterium]|nr:tetratricopeptide repeat protein [Calditrichia bacterium]